VAKSRIACYDSIARPSNITAENAISMEYSRDSTRLKIECEIIWYISKIES
jgi:hypothetical protein